MNKIYRIIWSKARNCYVVVSEIAKRNGKCSSGLNKKLIAAFLAAGTVLSVTGSAWAETHYYSVNADPKVQDNYDNDGATGKNAIAAGPKASAEGDSSIAIGNGAKTKGDSTSIVIGKGVTNFSVNPTIIGMGEHISQSSIVIGGKSDTRTTQAHGGEYNIVMGYGSTIHGQDATPGQTASNSIAIGTNSEVISTDSSIVMGTNSFVHTDIKDSKKGPQRSNYGVAIGTNTQVITRDGSWSNAQYNISKDSNGKSATGIAIGYDSIAAQGSVTIGQHTLEGEFGDISKIQPYSINRGSYGYFDYNTGVDNTTIGSNSFNDGNWSTIVGSYSLISDNYPGVSGAAGGGTKGVGATTVGSFNYNQNYKSTDGSSGVANTIMGLANTTDNSNTATIIGSGNTVKDSITEITNIQDVKGAKSANDMQSKLRTMIKDSKGGSVSVVGNSNTVTKATLSQVVGVGNTVGSADKAVVSSIAIGTGNTVTGSYSGAIGDPSTVSGDNSYAVGNNNTIEVEKGFILGNNATVTAAKSVALGDKSTAADAATVNGYDVTTGKAHVLADGEVASVWKATAGTVSVGGGTEGNEIVTRQITNVAAGSADTDAVNVAQLKKVSASVDGAKTHYYSVYDKIKYEGYELAVQKKNYNNDGATGTDSLAAGVAVGTKGMFSSVTGAYSTVVGKDTTGVISDDTTYEGTGASVYGSFNEVKADGDTYDGVGNSVVGLANTTSNANGSLLFGTGNVVKNSYGALNENIIGELREAYQSYVNNVIWYGANSEQAQQAYEALKEMMDAFGVSAPEDGGDVLAIGGANKAYNAVKSSMIGVKNTIGKRSEDVYDKTPVKFNSVIGYNNTIENGSNNSIIGTNRTISGVDGAIVIGSAADDGLTTSVVNSVVIGTEANVTLKDKESVALGSYSKADKLGGYATTGEDDVEIGTLKLSSRKFAGTGDNVVGTVSIGYVPESNQKASKPMTRTLTYVGAGKISATSTDAINGSQLFAALNAMQFDIVAGDNITVVTGTNKDGVKTYTISSSNATAVKPGTNVVVDGPETTTDSSGSATGGAATGTDTTSGAGTYKTDNYTVNAADSKVTDVAVTKGTSTTTGNKTETEYTVTVTSNEQSVENDEIVTKVVKKDDTFTVTDTDTKYTAEQTTEDGTDYGSGSTTFTVSEMDGEKTGAAVGAATLVAGENVKITKGEDGSAIISAQTGGGMTEISFNGDNKDAQIDNPKVLNIEGGATGELTNGNIGVESDGEDTLTVKLAKDIKGVDSVTVNKTVKVGDKTTIEGDQITTNTVNGDTINTNTINLGDTTIEEGDDNHITYKKGGNTYNIATVEDGMDYAGDDGKAIHKNLAEQLDIVGGAEDKASEYNIYTYNDRDKLRINLAKDVKGVDSVTVNKTVKVGDKTTIEGDKVTVGDTVIEGDQITTNTVKAGDTTINNDGLTIKNGPSITKNGVDAGGKKITNVAPGTDDTDAVNVSQLRQTAQDVTNLHNNMNRLDNRMRKGLAGAAALAALHPLDFDPDDKWEFSAGVGNYRGETAAAIGAFYHPNDDTIFSLGATVGNGDNMINGGVTFRFGQNNHQSRSKKAMAKEIVELRAEVAELKAMVYGMANGRMPGLDLTKSEEFPDTPENHWAYDYVSVLAGNGVLEGYQDGFFKGDRTLTRYEMAAIIYRAMMRGVDVDERMKEEFAPELARVKVDTLTSHSDGTPSIQRVRVIKGRE